MNRDKRYSDNASFNSSIIQTFHCRWKIIECIDICIGYSFLIFSEVRMCHLKIMFTSGECNIHHMCTRSQQTTANLSEILHYT
jgi:hypothetical protein